MTALPVPVQGGQIDRLNQFLNLSPQNFVLLIGFLVMALRGKGPFPILLLTGCQGSGKSTLSKMIRELIDPNEATLRFTPKDARDFAIEAASNYLPIFDNISHIPDWMSDFLCGISTGGAFALRRLYTDRDQEIFQFSNPVVLNSIVEIARRSDLLDRCLLVDLDTISKRRDEEQLWNDFRQAQPEILGALLNAVVTGIENWPSIQLTDPPRMADFARWITAAETGLGWSSGTFMKAYHENIDIGTSTALEQSSLTQALREIMTCRKTWKGSATELLNDLRESADWPGGREPMDWPRSPSALGNKLRRLAPSLELEGIKISTVRGNGGNRNRYTLVEKVDPVVQSSLNHQDES
jgi:energy-coupling factor transporter ATP-binding protein EcfA2